MSCRSLENPTSIWRFVVLFFAGIRQSFAISIRLHESDLSTIHDQYGSSTSHGRLTALEKPQEGSGNPNLCDSESGKQMPDLYLLGAPKAATTSLASDLVEAGVQLPLDNNETETKFYEFVFWNTKLRAREDAPIDRVKKRWLGYMPSCHANVRRPLADMSCRNFHVVNPVGGPTNKYENWTGLPATLRTVYGNQLHRVTFIALFREPMSRMQSEWYFMGFNRDYAMKYYGHTTFSDTLERIYADWKKLDFFWPKYWDYDMRGQLLWRTLYGNHLQQWLKDIPAEQFIVFPYKEYTDGNKKSICATLSKRLSYKIDCSPQSASINVNGHSRPTLTDDISSDLLSRFRDALASDKNAFVSSLSKLHEEGGVLANYKGGTDKHSILEWLHAGW